MASVNPNEKRKDTRFFLVDHGRYYAKEILNGCAFVPNDQAADAERMRQIRVGDVIFHAFEHGIAAVGRAKRPCRVLPYPAWRYADGLVGERGYWLDTNDLLLKDPIETDLSSERYLISLTETQAEKIISEILKRNPAIAKFFLH